MKDHTTNLEVQVKGLVVENGSLNERVRELEEKLRDREDASKDASMSSVIIHSPGHPNKLENDAKVESAERTTAATP
jgi:hypothetical protein